MIRFYTRNIGDGELAQFAVQIRAPWGDRHVVRGSIIQSTKPGSEGMPAVVWPGFVAAQAPAISFWLFWTPMVAGSVSV